MKPLSVFLACTTNSIAAIILFQIILYIYILVSLNIENDMTIRIYFILYIFKIFMRYFNTQNIVLIVLGKNTILLGRTR